MNAQLTDRRLQSVSVTYKLNDIQKKRATCVGTRLPGSQLKMHRAIATRYGQLANSFLGMVHLATARYWLKFVHAA